MSSSVRVERYAKWKLLIKEQERSGKSQKAFCESRGISSSKMSYYRSVLSAWEKPEPEDSTKLVPIKLKSATSVQQQVVNLQW